MTVKEKEELFKVTTFVLNNIQNEHQELELMAASRSPASLEYKLITGTQFFKHMFSNVTDFVITLVDINRADNNQEMAESIHRFIDAQKNIKTEESSPENKKKYDELMLVMSHEEDV